MSNLKQVSGAEFEQAVLRSNTPVLVDFYADWCAPCRAQAPILESVAQKFEGDAKIVKVDIDADPELAARFSVRSIPTLLLFNGGELQDTRVGVSTAAQLELLFTSQAA